MTGGFRVVVGNMYWGGIEVEAIDNLCGILNIRVVVYVCVLGGGGASYS